MRVPEVAKVSLRRSASYRASRVFSSAQMPVRFALPVASIAKAWAGEAYVRGAEENVQIHGGVGFTWEVDAHLYLRRALSSRELLGNTEYHHERIARHLEPGA